MDVSKPYPCATLSSSLDGWCCCGIRGSGDNFFYIYITIFVYIKSWFLEYSITWFFETESDTAIIYTMLTFIDLFHLDTHPWVSNSSPWGSLILRTPTSRAYIDRCAFFFTVNAVPKTLASFKDFLPTHSPQKHWNIFSQNKLPYLKSFFRPDRCSWCVMQRMEIYWHVGKSEHRWSSKVTWLKCKEVMVGWWEWHSRRVNVKRYLQESTSVSDNCIIYKKVGDTWQDMNLVIGRANVAPHDHVIDFPRSGKAKVSCVLAPCHVFCHPFGLPWQRDTSALVQRVKCRSFMAK